MSDPKQLRDDVARQLIDPNTADTLTKIGWLRSQRESLARLAYRLIDELEKQNAYAAAYHDMKEKS